MSPVTSASVAVFLSSYFAAFGQQNKGCWVLYSEIENTNEIFALVYILYWTKSELGASPIWLANQQQLSNTKQGSPAIINFSLDVIGQMGQLWR